METKSFNPQKILVLNVPQIPLLPFLSTLPEDPTPILLSSATPAPSILFPWHLLLSSLSLTFFLSPSSTLPHLFHFASPFSFFSLYSSFLSYFLQYIAHLSPFAGSSSSFSPVYFLLILMCFLFFILSSPLSPVTL